MNVSLKQPENPTGLRRARPFSSARTARPGSWFTFLAALVLAATASPLHAASGDLAIDGLYVFAMAVQPDGKIIIGGTFDSVLGVPRRNIARLNADGTLDMGFDPSANDWVFCIAVQADGKVLFGGRFTTLQPNGAASPTARQYIARVNANGTLDPNFDPKAAGETFNEIYSVAVQADGKVLLGGRFTTLQPNGAASPRTRRYIARVHADGTLDTGFNPNLNSWVYSIVVQSNGKVLLGGDFTTLQPNGTALPTQRLRIARVNADGTLDPGFNPMPNGPVYSVAMQADGTVLLGGDFTALQPNGTGSPITRWGIARVHASGALDPGFDPKPNGPVYSLAVQADGKVLLVGNFSTLQPNGAATPTGRTQVARVHAGGMLDPSFDLQPDNNVYGIALEADGTVLLGGRFTTLFARHQNDPATQTLSIPTSTGALWQRGGTAPELSRVTFDLSTDGDATWSSLGAGTRVGSTPDWQIAGLALPASGHLRARGVTTNGYYNGGSGLIEQVAAFVLPNDADHDGLLDAWELAYWPTTDGHSALDDWDGDGAPELLELAFGMNPTVVDIAGLPQVVSEAGFLTITIQKRPGVTYEVQSAGTLLDGQPDSFSPATTTMIIDNATTLKVRDNFTAATAARRFMRINVNAST